MLQINRRTKTGHWHLLRDKLATHLTSTRRAARSRAARGTLARSELIAAFPLCVNDADLGFGDRRGNFMLQKKRTSLGTVEKQEAAAEDKKTVRG